MDHAHLAVDVVIARRAGREREGAALKERLRQELQKLAFGDRS